MDIKDIAERLVAIRDRKLKEAEYQIERWFEGALVSLETSRFVNKSSGLTLLVRDATHDFADK